MLAHQTVWQGIQFLKCSTTIRFHVMLLHRTYTGEVFLPNLSVEGVVVVVFIFQYGNIHLQTSGSIFINHNVFEKKTI